MAIVSPSKRIESSKKENGHNFPLPNGQSGVTCQYQTTESNQFKARVPVVTAGTDQSKSELWNPYHFVGIPSQLGYKQTVSDQPVPWSQTIPRNSGTASVVAYYETLQHTRSGFRSDGRRNRNVPPHFVAPTEPDRKTTTLRQQISRVASVQRVSISPTSSPEGTTKLSDTIRWRSHSALGVANSPEPGHVTAFRDTPPSRADRRSFVYILGPATVGQTRAFCPEHMGTCMGYRVCQAR